MPSPVPVALRLPAELVAQVDAVAKRLSTIAAGTRVTRSDALRVVIARGVAALTAELDQKEQKNAQ